MGRSPVDTHEEFSAKFIINRLDNISIQTFHCVRRTVHIVQLQIEMLQITIIRYSATSIGSNEKVVSV